MAADVIIGEGRRAVLGLADFAVGDEAGFDEGLEAVTDSEDEAVAIFEEIHHGIGDARRAEDGGDKFSGAGGFITSAEASRDGENLGLGNFFRESGE